MNIIIDGLKINDKNQFHEYIKDIMKLPEYYGKNLDALWDCLTGWIDLPMKIEWRNYAVSKERLGCYADKILETFKEAEEELGDDFKLILSEL
ncbi:barstar family protein [Clostridium sp. ATCC 25772]|uniref:barstar family protein n=1 Tax=Clostridium sp. ATCC 25772 TaxID=1676991 RepID=UPI000781061D|nr:barstar family protein [Clostridium sp. ATCC 25772]